MAHSRHKIHKKLQLNKIVISLFLHAFGYSLFPPLFTCNTKNFTTSIPSGCWWHVLIKGYRWFKLKHMVVQYWDTNLFIWRLILLSYLYTVDCCFIFLLNTHWSYWVLSNRFTLKICFKHLSVQEETFGEHSDTWYTFLNVRIVKIFYHKIV